MLGRWRLRLEPDLSRFKFLHTADIHLDSPLRGLSRYEGVPADEVRIATRTALDNLVRLAIEEGVAFVVIAGDLYDGDWPDFGTGLYFCAVMGRLAKAGIAVFLLYGNHDAESVLTRKLPLPDNVQVFGTRKAATLVHEPTGTALHGWSYRDRDMRDNLAAGYPAAIAGRLNIGVLHTALTGRPPHAGYAPCTVPELVAKGYEYWALGHAHEFELIATRPFIVFPGNLQARNIREGGEKGAVLVTVEDDRIVDTPVLVPLDAVRWARVDVDVGGVEDEGECHRLIRDALDQAYDGLAHGRALVVRLTIAGATTMHADLGRRRDALREEVRGIAVAISERLWIEKVVIRTSAPLGDAAGDSGLTDELGQLLIDSAGDAELDAALAQELAEFFAKLPPDLGDDDEAFAALKAGDRAALIGDAVAALQARLAGTAG